MPAVSAAIAHPHGVVSQADTALVVADATWFSTESLFSELDPPNLATLLLHCVDYRNALTRRWPPWTWLRPTVPLRPRLWRREMILPTGWMKSFPKLGMRPIANEVRRWLREHAPARRFVLVITYPHYLYLRELLAPDQTIYLNIDDYAQYWPRRAARVRELERRAVRLCDLTACVAASRADFLRNEVPEAATKIQHVPHGCPSWGIAPEPYARPGPPPRDLSVIDGPRIGYVGSLEDRVDWRLLDELATALPSASLVMIGTPAPDRGRPWEADRRRCLARPNVRLLGWKPQRDLAAYIKAFDVCLIPYRVDHPFNQACNPTKIMDTMGTGRPIVATALPECLLHAHRFDVAQSRTEFIERVAAILARGGDDGRARLRHAFAQNNTCGLVAERLLALIDSKP